MSGAVLTGSPEVVGVSAYRESDETPKPTEVMLSSLGTCSRAGTWGRFGRSACRAANSWTLRSSV
jgi:hypothetical protein